MATLFKRTWKNSQGQTVTSDHWYVRGYTADGKKVVRCTRTADRGTALRILRQFEIREAEQRAGIAPLPPPPPAPLLSTFMEDYLSFSHARKRPNTAQADALALKGLLRIIGDLPLDGIGPRQIEDWQTRRLSEISPVSVRIEQRHLSAAFGTAVRWGHLKENPVRAVPPVRPPAPYRLRILSPEEVERLLSVIPDAIFRTLIEAYLYTGCRRNELLYLRWEDVDLDRGTLTVRAHEGFVPKTGRPRTVPLHPRLRELWKALPRTCALVFPSPHGRVYDESAVSHRFLRYRKKARLGDEVKLHTLRHTFASTLVNRGFSPYLVSRLLGHTDLRSTQIYLHETEEALRRVVEGLDYRDTK